MENPVEKIGEMVDEVAKNFNVLDPGLLTMFEKQRAIFWAIPDTDSKLEFLLGMVVALEYNMNKVKAQLEGT